VALVGLVPIVALFVVRRGPARALRSPEGYAFVLATLAPYFAYDGYLRSIAEWHWASGITRLHVLPALAHAVTSPNAFLAKLVSFGHAFTMLRATILGPVGFATFVLAILAAIFQPAPGRSRVLLFAWLAAALAYAYVVVTVERVDYYLYPFVPLAALATGGLAETVRRLLPDGGPRRIALAVAAVAAVAAIYTGTRAVAPYYHYGKAVYRQAKALDATLPPGALVVMGHYDPSVLYYIDRKGWEEDPYLWTPFDEQSAIHKGARAFIAIEKRRLAKNVELSAWLLRFPVAGTNGAWPVYITDETKLVPGAEERWRAFRSREKASATAPPRG
jgi:hypothetical protein